MWQLGLALGLLCIGAAVLRDRCIFGTAAALLVNWGINTAAVEVSGTDFPWGAFLTVDWLTGVFVLVGLPLICGRFTVGPIVIGLSYGLECIIHAAFGLSDQGPWPEYRYWQTLFWIAVGQALFVFGWGVYELARRHYRARRRLASDPHRIARSGAAQKNAEP